MYMHGVRLKMLAKKNCRNRGTRKKDHQHWKDRWSERRKDFQNKEIKCLRTDVYLYSCQRTRHIAKLFERESQEKPQQNKNERNKKKQVHSSLVLYRGFLAPAGLKFSSINPYLFLCLYIHVASFFSRVFLLSHVSRLVHPSRARKLYYVVLSFSFSLSS